MAAVDEKQPDGSGEAPQAAAGDRPNGQVGRSAPGGGSGSAEDSKLWRLGVLLAGVVALGIWNPPLLIVILSLIVVIFLHELGHYLAARRADMKVTEFFIGFGPRIWSFRRGETEYGLKVIPAGAYVRIIGMVNIDEVPPEDEDRTYRQKSYGQRMLVAVAGSGMHFLIALLLLFVIGVVWGRPAPPDQWVIDDISPGSAAASSQLQEGDQIISVNGTEIETFTDLGDEIVTRPNQSVELLVERDGSEVVVPVTLGGRMAVFGTVGEDLSIIASDGRLVIGGVAEDGVVAEAGLEPGESLVEINGEDIVDFDDVGPAVEKTGNGQIEVTVADSAGEPRTATLDLGESLDYDEAQGFLGVGPGDVLVRENPAESAVSSFREFGSLTKDSVVAIGRFFSPSGLSSFAERVFSTAPTTDGQDVVPQSAQEAAQQEMDANQNRIVSIVGAASLGSQLTEESLLGLFTFLVFINIFIGLINMVPLLPLDGGHVAIATYERIRELRRHDGRRYMVDAARLMPVAYAVVAVLVSVGLMALYLDLVDPINL
ncbi:MAG: RIP metalloprotease RseP [Actinobacteria bacterium]|nr:MAG: RIP metalloprotease RseP [Actinomycetota bacterium]RIK08475.1 MAG: RIP metalloprotease RseP [Acidobacteriota bacterium]